MKKLFLYIDESKEYKNNILYMGGIYGEYGLHAMNLHCWSIFSRPYELSSTRCEDREEYLRYTSVSQIKYNSFCRTFLEISSDKQYLEGLQQYIKEFVDIHKPTDLSIFADFIRLDKDMSSIERAFSKSLSSRNNCKISLRFLNSKNNISIQFADLEIWLHRRWEK